VPTPLDCFSISVDFTVFFWFFLLSTFGSVSYKTLLFCPSPAASCLLPSTMEREGHCNDSIAHNDPVTKNNLPEM